ncbi:unnamed protein product [Brugia pahangi]|uniref:Secreted protein n=1 Tax=Brugia pahangi TaxID=6280 RepID=A0A0N4TTE9_BRUPA|nr:unnamed protein product [Brugia pahangi]
MILPNAFHRGNLPVITHSRGNCAASFDMCLRRNYWPFEIFLPAECRLCRLNVGGREDASVVFVRDFAFRAFNICARRDFVCVEERLDVYAICACYLF